MAALPCRVHVPGHQPPVEHRNEAALLLKLQREALDHLHVTAVTVQEDELSCAVTIQAEEDLTAELIQNLVVDVDGSRISTQTLAGTIRNGRCDQNITLLLDTTADKILMDGDQAVGIHATGKTGNNVTVNAQSVVLTSGGFGANLAMVEQYKPELKGFMTTNAPGIQGQGIEMATEVGAATVDMDQIQIHPTVQYDTAALITEGLRGDGAILVNAEGQRFIDEVGTRDVVSAAEIAQTDSYSWLVVDQKMVDASAVIQGYIKKGYTVTGEDYKALAEAMGVDAAAFEETMTKWNGYVADKKDPDFNRTSFAEPLDTAPYYAIKVTAGVHHTMGGVKINTSTEVLNEQDAVIPGLYAAGEVTGGVHGANRLGGNAVADFTVFGRIAGQNAAAHAAGTAETPAETKAAA